MANERSNGIASTPLQAHSKHRSAVVNDAFGVGRTTMGRRTVTNQYMQNVIEGANIPPSTSTMAGRPGEGPDSGDGDGRPAKGRGRGVTIYWQRQLNRRRFVVTSGAVTAAGALMMACGSGGEGGSSQKSASLITPFKDTSKDAKRGGTFSGFVEGDELNIDPLTTSRGTGYGGPGLMAYSRFLREEEGAGGTAKPNYLGDIAESWELSEGGTRLTFKLRKDVKFDPRAPTNGRLMDADDVIYSWNRILSSSPYKSQLDNNTDPSSGVQSVQKTDANTIVFRMAFPWVPLFAHLASGTFMILPREAEDKFNVRQETRGSGPWMLEKYEPSVQFQWSRNPNYFLKELTPFLDGYRDRIITEAASQESAVRSKQLDAYRPNAEKVLGLFRDMTGVNLYRLPLGPNVNQLMFGSQTGSIWHDVRVRRAASMALDRQLVAEVDTSASAFETAGIPYEIILDSHLSAAYKSSGLWLDPNGKEIGEGGKYFKHDVAEAKKLLAATGSPSPEMTFHFSSRGAENQKKGEIAGQMLQEAGFRVKLNSADYQTVWLPIIYVAPAGQKGRWEGTARGGSTSGLPDVLAMIYARLHTKGAFTGVQGAGGTETTAATDALIDKMMQEFDEKKREALIHDLQKQLAVTQATVSYGNGFHLWDVVWPWVQNWGFLASWQNTGSHYPHVREWLDETKRT